MDGHPAGQSHGAIPAIFQLSLLGPTFHIQYILIGQEVGSPSRGHRVMSRFGWMVTHWRVIDHLSLTVNGQTLFILFFSFLFWHSD